MPTATKDAVLFEHTSNPAVAALLAWKPAAIADAIWDRNELTLTLVPEDIRQAARTVQLAAYNFLEDVTAVDWYPIEPRFQISYHIVSHSMRKRIRLRAFVKSDNPVIDSITTVWPSANFYEREVFDLFGVRFSDHPNMRRIMMPDEWEGHPLRKDYPVEGYR